MESSESPEPLVGTHCLSISEGCIASLSASTVMKQDIHACSSCYKANIFSGICGINPDSWCNALEYLMVYSMETQCKETVTS